MDLQNNLSNNETQLNMTAMLKQMVENHASDIFIVAGRPISYKLNRQVVTLNDERIMPNVAEKLIMELFELANRDKKWLAERGDDDFSFAIRGISRFRVNAYKQRGSLAAVIRVVEFSLPNPEDLHIPGSVLELAHKQRGLVLVTGSSSSGKTTTLTCILDKINQERASHIITLEDPIEHLHQHKKSIISQREISLDTGNYPIALRAALRQSPDVILIGELRDDEAISISLTAAETGHLVFSALHTLGAANSVDRLVDTFPPEQQEQIKMQLSMVLQSVVCQQLLPTVDGGLYPVFEVMHCNNAIRTLIRDGRTHQINSIIQSSASEGMISMDASIANLYKQGIITRETAMTYSLTPNYLLRQIGENGTVNENSIKSRLLNNL